MTLFQEGVDQGDHQSALNNNYKGVLEAFNCLDSKNDAIIDSVGDGQLEEEAQQYDLESGLVKNEV